MRTLTLTLLPKRELMCDIGTRPARQRMAARQAKQLGKATKQGEKARK